MTDYLIFNDAGAIADRSTGKQLIDIQCDIPRANFEVGLSRSSSAILSLKTSGDLIDLTRISYLQKLYVFQRTIKRLLLFVSPIRVFF